MKIKILQLVFFLFTGSHTFEAMATDWVRLERGLEYTTLQINPLAPNASPAVIKNSLTHAFRIDPKFFELKPLVLKPGERAPIKKMQIASGALVAVNANFFDPEGKALGLIINQGQILNSLKKVSWWGVFLTEKGWPSIVHSTEFNNRPTLEMALQAGPRLVIDGHIPKLKPGSRPRTAIGITKNGHIILLTSLNPVELSKLAQTMLLSDKKGGLECENALNFDGGSSSQMEVSHARLELHLPSYVTVPVGLGVFRR